MNIDKKYIKVTLKLYPFALSGAARKGERADQDHHYFPQIWRYLMGSYHIWKVWRLISDRIRIENLFVVGREMRVTLSVWFV